LKATSEGGYGGDAFSRQSQQGIDPFKKNPPQDPREQNNIPGGPEGRTGDDGLPGKIYTQATQIGKSQGKHQTIAYS